MQQRRRETYSINVPKHALLHPTFAGSGVFLNLLQRGGPFLVAGIHPLEHGDNVILSIHHKRVMSWTEQKKRGDFGGEALMIYFWNYGADLGRLL